MRVMGIVWAACATLPFLETFLFNVRVNSGRQSLGFDDYIRIGGFSLFLFTAMCFAFVVEKDHVSKLWSDVKKSVRSLWKNWKEYVALLFLAALIYVLYGRQAAMGFIEADLTERIEVVLSLLGIGAWLWFVSRLVKSVGESLPSGLKEGVDSWALSLRASVPFYFLLFLGTWVLSNFNGINRDMKFWSQLSTAKDYFLLFMIASLLYGGLFKLARAKALAKVFGQKKGVLYFMVICGMIAVFAVWADFRTLDPVSMERIFPQQWQRRDMVIHIFIRDIGLLLFPISWLLFWTLKHVAMEIHDERGGGKTRIFARI